jgi:2-polyprenyl-3-methyl-5-hydroxy-6-metoxy-1,4-benzoquinol methylase
MPFLGDDRLEGLGRHNPAWGPGRHDVRGYLEASEKRYVYALCLLRRSGAGPLRDLRLLDVGGFMGAFPLALRRIGAEVALTEKYDYYYGAFDPIRDLLADAGVQVLDVDFTEPLGASETGRFDAVFNMAVAEHLAHSPRPMMDNTRAVLVESGRLLLEVPNLAYWPRRMALLRGETVHPPLPDVYVADPPFTGHHREYTEADLRELHELAGFTVHDLVTLNYTPHWPPPTGPAKLMTIPRRRLRSARELLLACSQPAASKS